MQTRLERAVAQTATPVRIVCKMVPLPMHPGAGPAIAARIGCAPERHRADLAAAEQRVAADLRDAAWAGVRALPTIFIGGERINGASASVEQLVAMIDRAPRS